MPKKKEAGEETPAQRSRKVVSLRLANATGDRLESLRALADRLAAEIDKCQSAAVLPALTRQYRETLAAIAELRPEEDSDVEEIIGGFEKVR